MRSGSAAERLHLGRMLAAHVLVRGCTYSGFQMGMQLLFIN